MESHEVTKAIDDRLMTAERSVAVNQYHDAVTGVGGRERERGIKVMTSSRLCMTD